MSFYSKICVGLIALLPLSTLAASGYLESLANSFKTVINIVLPAFVGLAVIGFAYGIFVYLQSGAEDKERGKVLIFWGGLSVIVLLSLYALASLFQQITGATTTTIKVPSTVNGLIQQ
ncbi:MAG: hypothetical protein WC385_00745 [Candidatus Paceibacterota bacterium]|jgi:prepilin signal peptidase PulO-like enzyme (type II secretory pathway)